jgi:hypothetical protein
MKKRERLDFKWVALSFYVSVSLSVLLSDAPIPYKSNEIFHLNVGSAPPARAKCPTSSVDISRIGD